MKKFSTQNIGEMGEEYAVKFLNKKKYKILERNYRKRYGEIDIIAENKNYIVFVEVKTRRDRRFAEPHQALTKAKQKRILIAANHYIRFNQIDAEIRFDLITIIPSETPPLTHYEEVFVPFIF